jgi:hypothetical protein
MLYVVDTKGKVLYKCVIHCYSLLFTVIHNENCYSQRKRRLHRISGQTATCAVLLLLSSVTRAVGPTNVGNVYL